MSEIKSEKVQVLMSPEEKAMFERAAKEVGLSLSSWMRTVCLASARKVLGTKDGTRPTV